MSETAEPWWTTAFAACYPLVYAHRDDAQAAREIAGLLPHLPAGPILDAGCGGGRHLAALRAAGRTALGFDFSRDLLAQARQRPTAQGRLVRADQRCLPFSDGGFAAVLVLFTGFGYFSDGENAAALAGLARLLAPGGVLVLDLPEPRHLAAHLVPESRRTVGEAEIHEQRRLRDHRVEKDVRITRPGHPEVTWTERVRLYDEGELRTLAAKAGLHHGGCWTGLGGPTDDAHRLVHWLRT